MLHNEAAIGKIGDRYEIRRLRAEDAEWAAALGILGNHFYSPLWTKVYPTGATELTYSISAAVTPLIPAIVTSDMCLGVWDTQYKFKRPESEASGGKLYWDRTKVDKSKQELEDEMDFPLVHIALSFDGSQPPPEAIMKQVFGAMPLWGWFEGEFEKASEAKESTSAENPQSKTLKRCGTSTRGAYMDQGIFKACSYFLMELAKKHNYNFIDMDSAHPVVTKVWMNPPAPYQAKFIYALKPEDYVNKSGELEQQFSKSGTSLDRIQVTL